MPWVDEQDHSPQHRNVVTCIPSGRAKDDRVPGEHTEGKETLSFLSALLTSSMLYMRFDR